jgi:Mn2+/Fe2+ NRAMP family transporter
VPLLDRQCPRHDLPDSTVAGTLIELLDDGPVFYGLVLAGTLGGTALSLAGLNPIRLLVFVAVLNGIAAAPFLVLVMLIANDTKIMGEYVNGKVARLIGWSTAVLMAAAAIALFAFAGGGGLY